MKRRYQNTLRAEVSGFVEYVNRMEHGGINGMELVYEVLMSWKE